MARQVAHAPRLAADRRDEVHAAHHVRSLDDDRVGHGPVAQVFECRLPVGRAPVERDVCDRRAAHPAHVHPGSPDECQATLVCGHGAGRHSVGHEAFAQSHAAVYLHGGDGVCAVALATDFERGSGM